MCMSTEKNLTWSPRNDWALSVQCKREAQNLLRFGVFKEGLSRFGWWGGDGGSWKEEPIQANGYKIG